MMDEEKTAAAGSEPENAEKQETSKSKKKKDRTAELEKELAAKDDRYLRLLAEYDNYKKRTVRERETNELAVRAEVLKSILPLADSVERAAASAGDAESIKSGVTMALGQFIKSLEKEGLTEIPTDIPFNPELHNAVMHIEDENLGAGEITEVFQKGYRIKDKVIRYAMVKVAN